MSVKGELLSIYFSSEKFKIAYAKGLPGKPEITAVSVKDIRGLSDSDISQALKASLVELKVKTRTVVCNISSQLIITKNIEIPSRNPQEIQEIINLQSGRYTPYAREEIIVDYVNIGVYRQNYTKALLIIIPKDVVHRYTSLLLGTGLDVIKVSVAPEAICAVYAQLAHLKNEEAPVSLVHLDAQSTDFIVSLKGKMIFARNIPLGIEYFHQDKEKFKQKFIDEIKRSIEAYQAEDIERTPNKMIFAGSVNELLEIKPFLDNNIYIPSSITDYAQELNFSKSVTEIIVSAKQISFLDVSSPLFVYNSLEVDLTPKEISLKKALIEKGKDLIKMGILAMAAFVLICGVLMSKVYLKSIYLDNLSAKYLQANQEAEGLEKSYSRMEIIREYLSTRGYSLEVLTELNNVILPDIYLNHVKFVDKKEFSIKGSSLSMSTVFTLVSNMEKSAYFQNVKTRYTTKRKEGTQDLTDFHIVCALEGPGEDAQQQEE